MMLFKLVVGAFTCALLAGCGVAQTKVSSDVAPGAVAKLRVVAFPNVNTFFKFWDEKGCAQGPEKMKIILGGPANMIFSRGTHLRQGIPLGEDFPQKQMAELLIDGGKIFYGHFKSPRISGASSAAIQYEWCGVSFAFNPKPGGVYEAVFSSGHELMAGKACSVKLFRIVESQSRAFERVAEESLIFDSRSCQ